MAKSSFFLQPPKPSFFLKTWFLYITKPPNPSFFRKTRVLNGKQMRKIQFRSGYYYHIYNRGVNRQAIFFNDENWGYFMRRLRHYCTSELIEIIAYCLMPNHYHILLI